MRIGISIMAGEKQNLWNDGLIQNIYHLASLLDAIPFVEAVYLVNCEDGRRHPTGVDEGARRFPLISPAEAFDVIDLGIEMGGAIDIEWIRRFRYRGGKFVLHICGQPYASLIEPTIFGRDGYFPDPERCEEIWLLAKDMAFAPMLRTIHRCPVHEVPFLWSPRFLEQALRGQLNGSAYFGYRPESLTTGTARAAIFEPNISPIKMGLIPFMICDSVESRSSAVIDRVSFLNAESLRENNYFEQFIQKSSLYHAGKVVITGRDYFVQVMSSGYNIVVSHQLHCQQNYLYLDALHGNYPLIHNSEFFRGIGYYYTESDIAAGARMFLEAVRCHDRNLESYRRRGREVIASLAPTARSNVDYYARRLLALTDTTPSRRSA